ncbi:MAG: hypothetical protein JNM75_11960 [Rhodospirillales bacterium]|nr:hypothetical protein [Rhodospirillales bacterium]
MRRNRNRASDAERTPRWAARGTMLLALGLFFSCAFAALASAEPAAPPAPPPVDAHFDAQSPRAKAAAIAALTVEEAYDDQDALLSAALAGLAPQRPGRTDIYFLGFAGVAYEDVFLHEARSAQALFDAAYGTEGRSLLLANNVATLSEDPLASTHNLQAAISGLGRVMDPNEDVAVIFLTSHGAPEQLAVEFRPLALNDLSPRALRAMLDDAGIGWRVIIVSACYSGSFIDALRSERTLVITAARADRASFGCAAGNQFTYFGEALFAGALRHGGSLVAGFQAAALSIAARERREGLRPSLPQLELGDAIAAKLGSTPLAGN